MISLPELQNNAGRFIVAACSSVQRASCVLGADWPAGLELHSAAPLRDPLAQRESVASAASSDHQAGAGRAGDDVMRSDTGGPALKSDTLTSALLTAVFRRRGKGGAEAVSGCK